MNLRCSGKGWNRRIIPKLLWCESEVKLRKRRRKERT